MFIFFLTSTALGNPTELYITPFGYARENPATFLFVTFLVTIFFEFVIVSLLLRKIRQGWVLLSVLSVNLVSFPLVLFLSNIIRFEYKDMLPLIPILVETPLYVVLFRLFFKKGWIQQSLSMGRCFLIGIFPNIFTFLLGVLFMAFLGSKSEPSIPRIKSDMRIMAYGFEAYSVDHGVYPSDIYSLTTPFAYIKGLFPDPYKSRKRGAKEDILYNYLSWKDPGDNHCGYIIWAMGPDMKYDLNEGIIRDILKNPNRDSENPVHLFYPYFYNPVNGIKSRGDIIRIGGDWK